MAFEINKNILKIEAGEKIYEVDPIVSELYANAAHKKLIEFNDILVAGDAKPKDVEDAIINIKNDIEKILGEGAVREVFAEKEAVSLHDMMDLVVYIRSLNNEFETKKSGAYVRMGKNPHKK